MLKYCTRCGSMISENAKFCGMCGAPNIRAENNISRPQPINKPVTKTKSYNPIDSRDEVKDGMVYITPTNGVAICSYICSLIGLFIYSAPLGAMSMILGIFALNRISCTKEKGNALAALGCIIGIFELVTHIYFMVTEGLSIVDGITMHLINLIK